MTIQEMENVFSKLEGKDPEDYEDLHDHMNDEDDIYNESYVFDKGNYEQNLDKWAPGTPLWIAGASGDGKSTLAKKYAKEHKATLAPLDIFLCRIAGTKEKFEKFLKDDTGTVMNEGSKIILDYIDKHPEITWAKSGDEYFDRGQNPELWNQLFNWLLKVTKNDPKYNKNLYIFEGCSICMMDIDKAKKLPIIVTGTSRLTGSRRRMHRDTEEHSDYSILKVIWRELKRITGGNFKKLNDNKDKFIKNLSKTVQESDEGTTKGYRYTDGRDGEGIYEALKSEMYQKNGLSPAAWLEFLNSDACKWLPKPPKYDKDNESWFTEEGNEKFKELTLPIVKEYIKNVKMETEDIPNERIVYSDEYQFITDNSIPVHIQEATLSTKERNKLDDSDFGIPELRKYPLTDKKHVRSAVSYFHKAPAKYKPQLAKRILRAAHKYGMDTENWDTINEYAKKKSHVQESFIPLKREGMDWDHTSDSYTFDNPNIHMRPATEDDIENMYQWEMESIDKSLQNDEKVQSLIRQDCHDSLKDTQIITDHDEPIGMLTTCMIDNGEWRYIGEIYLIPEYRGQGIGSNILKQEIAKYNKIRLQVSMDNKGALNLYTSLGFKIVKENPEGRMYIMEYERYPDNVQEAAYTNSGINQAEVHPVMIVYKRFSTKNKEQLGPIAKLWKIANKYFPETTMLSGFGWDWTGYGTDFAYGIIINNEELPDEFMEELKEEFPDIILDENFLIPNEYEETYSCAESDMDRVYDEIWNKGFLECELEDYPSEGQMKISVIYKKDLGDLEDEVAKHIKSVQEFVDPIAKMKDDVTGSMNFMNYLMKVDLLTKGSVSESLKQLKHSAPNGLHPVMFMGYMDPEGVNRSDLKDLEKQVIYADDENNIYSCFFNSHARRHEISQIASSFETFINDLPKRKVTQPNIIKAYANPMIELEKDGRIIHSHHELPFTSLDNGSDGCYMNTYYSYFAILEAFEFKRNQLYHDICNVILDQFDGDEDKFDFRSVEVNQVNWATAEILFRFKYDNDSFIVVIRTVSMRTQPAKLYHDNSPKNEDGDAYVGGNDFEEINHNNTNGENAEDEDASMTEMCIGSNDYGVCYQEYDDNGKIKVNNVPYNMMYFGSYKDFGNNMLKLDNPRLFVTPFKGIASIFTIDRSRYMIPKGKSCNLAYDEWKKDISQLDKPFDDVHVKVEGIPEMEHRSFENEGWIYGIDISNLKDHIYQEPWMDSEREFLILDVDEIPIAMKLNHKSVVYVEGADRKDVREAPKNENVFYSNHRVSIDVKSVKKYMKKGNADLTIGLQHLHVNDKVKGYIWDTKDGDIVAYVAVEEKKDGNWIVALELANRYQGKGYGKQLLEFAETELNADHLSVNKNNKRAIALYSENGWATYKDDDAMVYMKKNTADEPVQEYAFDEEFIQESQELVNRNLSILGYDPKTQTIDSHIKDTKTGENFRIKLIINDNDPYFKTHNTPASAHYGNEYLTNDNKDCDKFLANSFIRAKSRLLSMRNNASVAVLNHEMGHIIDKIHQYFPERIVPEDNDKLKKLRSATAEVFENTKKNSLNKHDRKIQEPFADAFGATYTSPHSMRKALKTTKGRSNIEYSELKQLRKEYEKLRAKFPLEEQQRLESAIKELTDQYYPLIEKRDNLENDDWEETGKYDKEIAELTTQIEPLKNKIKALQSDMRKFNDVKIKEAEIADNRNDHHSQAKADNRHDMTKKIIAKMNEPSLSPEATPANTNETVQESWNDFKHGINSHSKKLMFHISDDPDLDEITMEPRVPSYIVEKSNNNIDPNYPEDATIPRICVSPSIEGCIIATFSHKDVKYRLNDLIYVYTPMKPFDEYKHKTNKELVKEKLVFDANITGEAWILEPCKMRLFGIIRIKKVPNMINKETVNKGIRVSSGSFDWEWVLAPKAAAGWFYPDEEPEEEPERRGKNLADPDGEMPGSNKSKEELEQELAKYIKTVTESFIPLKRENKEWEHDNREVTFDNPNIHMRPATEDDIENMYTWEMESIDKSLQEDEKVQNLIRQDCHDSLNDTQMIMDGDKTIGMFTACMIDNGEWRYIGEIYLIPEYRGQHIGSTILRNEIENYDKIRLQVAMDNENAMKLYTSLGFKIVKENDEGQMHIMEYIKPENFQETVTVDGHRLIELAYFNKITNLTPEQEQIVKDYANARDQLQAAAAYYTRETKARKKSLKRMQLEHNTSKSEYQRDQLNRKMARTRIELDVLARDYAEAYQRNVKAMNELADKFDEIELSKKDQAIPTPVKDDRDSITIPIPKILRKPRELLGSFLKFEDENIGDEDTDV